MFETKDQHYKRSLNKWLTAASQAVQVVQFDQTVTWEQKLKALDVIQTELANAKRAVMYFINTRSK